MTAGRMFVRSFGRTHVLYEMDDYVLRTDLGYIYIYIYIYRSANFAR